MTLIVWIILHSLLWDGEIQRDEDLPFPFDLIAKAVKGGEIEFNGIKEPISRSSLNETVLLEKSNEGLSSVYAKSPVLHRNSSLAQISVNNLYNLITNPFGGALSLTLGFFFVSIWLIFIISYNGKCYM